MKKLLYLILLIVMGALQINSQTVYDEQFNGTGSYSSDFDYNNSQDCLTESYSITDVWNLNNCQLLQSQRTGNGQFYLYQSDPHNNSLGREFFEDDFDVSQTGQYTFSVRLNHKNETPIYPYLNRDIPVIVSIDGDIIAEFIIEYGSSFWVTKTVDFCIEEGTHILRINEDESGIPYDDDFAMDNILISFTAGQTQHSPSLIFKDQNGNIITDKICFSDQVFVVNPDPSSDSIMWTLNDGVPVENSGNWVEKELSEIFSNGEFCPGEFLDITAEVFYDDPCELSVLLEGSIEIECCNDAVSAEFTVLKTNVGGGKFSIYAVSNYDVSQLPTNCGPVIETWCLYESDNLDGPYATIESASGPEYLYDDADVTKFYKLVHKIHTPCGEDCAELIIVGSVNVPSLFVSSPAICPINGCDLYSECQSCDFIVFGTWYNMIPCGISGEGGVRSLNCEVLSIVIDFGDGTSERFGKNNQGVVNFSGSKVYAQNGTYTLTITAYMKDANGNFCTKSKTQEVVVSNCIEYPECDDCEPIFNLEIEQLSHCLVKLSGTISTDDCIIEKVTIDNQNGHILTLTNSASSSIINVLDFNYYVEGNFIFIYKITVFLKDSEGNTCIKVYYIPITLTNCGDGIQNEEQGFNSSLNTKEVNQSVTSIGLIEGELRMNIISLVEINASIVIYNVSGQPLMTQQKFHLNKGETTYTIGVDHLSSGAYFAQIRTAEGFTTHKFILTN